MNILLAFFAGAASATALLGFLEYKRAEQELNQLQDKQEDDEA